MDLPDVEGSSARARAADLEVEGRSVWVAASRCGWASHREPQAFGRVILLAGAR